MNKNLNLNEFIQYFNLDMILNNTPPRLIEFELYNQEELINSEWDERVEELKDELRDVTSANNWLLQEVLEYTNIELDELKNTPINESIELLDTPLLEYITDNIYYDIEPYQYFIIAERDLRYWIKYTNYPVYYNDDFDLYLLGITHYGMSWDYFYTSYAVPGGK